MISRKNIPIIIVGYCNAKDILECLKALQALVPDPKFDIYICENGGTSAFDALISALTDNKEVCESSLSPHLAGAAPRFLRIQELTLSGTDARVMVAEANANLGYAAAINAWLHILEAISGWPGIWILNPDTEPSPHALAELVLWSGKRKRGMVGSRIVRMDRPDVIHSRGLRWRRFYSSTEAVDYLAPAAVEPDADTIEERIDAPSGASIYVTRECLDKIGLMDEQYFLYFEDLDWGYRAKKACGIGYAYKSIVPHHVGTTIGTARSRLKGSRLSIYLEFRNRIHFIRKYHRAWLPWSLVVLLFRSLEYAITGNFGNMQAAFGGVLAGVARKTGRPEHINEANNVKPRAKSISPE